MNILYAQELDTTICKVNQQLIPFKIDHSLMDAVEEVEKMNICNSGDGAKLFAMLKSQIHTSQNALYQYYFGDGISLHGNKYKAPGTTKTNLEEYYKEIILGTDISDELDESDYSFLTYNLPLFYNRLAVLKKVPMKSAVKEFSYLLSDLRKVHGVLNEIGVGTSADMKSVMKGVRKGSEKYLNNPSNLNKAKITLHKKRLRAVDAYKRLSSGHYGYSFKNVFKGLGKKMGKGLMKGIILALVLETSLSHGRHELDDLINQSHETKYISFMEKDSGVICMTFKNFEKNCFMKKVNCKKCSQKLQNKNYSELELKDYLELSVNLPNTVSGCEIQSRFISELLAFYDLEGKYYPKTSNYINTVISIYNTVE